MSRGAAVAAFNAYGTGGRVILNRPGSDQGVPSDSERRVIIRPIPGSRFDGAHYCVEDWHVLTLAWIDGGNKSFTMQDAQQSLGATTTRLFLDDVELDTDRTPIKRLLAPDAEPFNFEEAYFVNQGTILSPDKLSPGRHTLEYRTTFGEGSTESGRITFFVDPAGTGTCH